MACSKSRGSLMREIKNLMRRPLEDITIEVNAHNLSILTAYILGPEGTPFEQGRFRIELQFPDSYPQQPPKGFFKTKIWHPNVLWNGGDICVDTLKRGWNEKMGVRDILIAVRSLMIVPNYDSALNGEAGKQIISSYEEFEAIARQKTDFYAESAETYRKVKFLPFCILRECITKRALQSDSNSSNRQKGLNGDDMLSEAKENDPSKSNEFAANPMDTVEEEHGDSKGKENDERNAKKKHKSKDKSKKSKGKKSKHKSKLSKSMGRY